MKEKYGDEVGVTIAEITKAEIAILENQDKEPHEQNKDQQHSNERTTSMEK